MGEIYPTGIITPGIREEMISSEFWIAKTKNARDIIMSPRQIEKFNQEIIKKVETVCDIKTYNDSLHRNELTGYINAYDLPQKTMCDAAGQAVKNGFYTFIRQNLNIGEIKEKNPVKWGIAVRKTSLRSFPTAEGVFDSGSSTEIDRNSMEIDRFQETGVQACEAVLILHRSKDRKWYFVQTNNYRGWVDVEDIAVAADKTLLIDYLYSPEFVVVTGNWVGEFDMGTRIPAAGDYIVMLPARGRDGILEFRQAVITGSEDVSRGYLPYTRENIIRQAFKLLGDRYDWGNKYRGRDCSSFIQVIYKTFGFNLPRNASEQARCPGRVIGFDGADTVGKRYALLDRAKPGAAIYMPGHVMMYLGKADGGHYMIHDFTGYGRKDGAGWTFVPVYQVAVTSTLLPLACGPYFIEKFTSVLHFE